MGPTPAGDPRMSGRAFRLPDRPEVAKSSTGSTSVISEPGPEPERRQGGCEEERRGAEGEKRTEREKRVDSKRMQDVDLQYRTFNIRRWQLNIFLALAGQRRLIFQRRYSVHFIWRTTVLIAPSMRCTLLGFCYLMARRGPMVLAFQVEAGLIGREKRTASPHGTAAAVSRGEDIFNRMVGSYQHHSLRRSKVVRATRPRANKTRCTYNPVLTVTGISVHNYHK